MIESTCSCGTKVRANESETNTARACEGCGAQTLFVAAEQIPEGTGSADFDASLSLPCVDESGSPQVWRFNVGGVLDIEIGKLPTKHIVLGGSQVSRSHARLVRVDFAPSRWKLIDQRSTNGTFVNNQRITEHDLQNGDVIRIGENEMTFAIDIPKPAPPPMIVGGINCPSCGTRYKKLTKICVPCGIDLVTGKHLVTSRAIDENDLAIRADTWIRVISWLIWIGLFPIASEAFGTKKPIATWAITIITAIASIGFAFAMMPDDPSPTVLNLMEWTGDHRPRIELPSNLTQRLSEKDLREVTAMIEQSTPADVGFHWWQPLTSALLHDPSSVLGFVLHLGGNLLFLFVFGMRVNELIGNVKFAIIYPLLAFGAGLVDMVVHLHDPLRPGLGASGAIMGLAGMYLIFFPVRRVHCVAWIRAGILTRWRCFYKVFRMHGFWLLALWVGFNDVLPLVLHSRGNVNHWAHVGGFAAGVMIALVLLLARMTDAHRADIISVALGKRSWSLLGKPTAAIA